MEGFDAGSQSVPAPLVEVAGETRERLVNVVTAILDGRTPEQIAEYLEAGEFPGSVSEWLARPGERPEINAHVDLILGVLQAPAGTAA